jgi:hypothetical protein
MSASLSYSPVRPGLATTTTLRRPRGITALRSRGPALLAALTVLTVLTVAGAASAQMPYATQSSGYYGAHLGRVAGVGDIDKDGYLDFVMGAPKAAAAASNGGAAWIISGRTLQILVTKLGTGKDDYLGDGIDGVGDVNKDGWPDWVCGAWGSDVTAEDAGMAQVWSGKTGALLHTFHGSAAHDHFGGIVAGVGDVNKDGYADVAAAAVLGENAANVTTGWVRVYSGATGAVLHTFYGATDHELYGYGLDGAGDVNGDGWPDIVIGAPSDDTGGSGAGRLEVRSGKDGALLLSKLGTASQHLGHSVAGGGDVNGDGLMDVVAGRPGDQGGMGSIQVFLGPAGATGPAFSGTSNIDRFGSSVALVGDADHDGRADILAGAPQSAGQPGYARLYSGATGLLLWSTIQGTEGGAQFGNAVAALGDLDGDGWLEVGIAAPDADVGDPGSNSGTISILRVAVAQPHVGSSGPGNALLQIYGEPLAAGGTADLRLSGAAPQRPAYLLASLGLANVPFKGGTLVPQPAGAAVFALATDALGKLTLPGIPGGGYGFLDVYVQCVISDPMQTQGWALSNGVRAEFLP